MEFGPHPLTLRQLQYAVAVAEAKSFRRAAERCHVSQPSLSAQIAELEEAVGARLFDRDRRGVLVTRAGEEVIERARKILVQAHDLIEAGKRYADPLAGALRLGVIPTIGPYLLPKIDPALRRAFPRITFLWTEEKTDALVPMIEAGELDAALVALETDLGTLDTEVVARDPFVLALPRRHRLAKLKGPINLEELENEEVLLLDEGHCLREQALELCNASRARELGFRATSLGTLVQMVAGGTGITLLPRLSTKSEHPKGMVIRELTPEPSRTLGIAWRKGSALTETIRAIADAIRA